MSIYVFDLFDWIEKQDPDTMPYRPRVPHTQGFGLREHMEAIEAGASPGHLGNDRGGHPTDSHAPLLMPFDGTLSWKSVGKAAGSLLRIIPEDKVPVELQVFHTLPTDNSYAPFEDTLARGDETKVRAWKLGLSFGVHTHTEFITEYLPHRVEFLRSISTPICTNGEVNNDYLFKHGRQYGIDRASRKKIRYKLRLQMKKWRIEEIWDRFAVRSGLPDYRTPHWGDTKTIHMCTRTFLQI